MIEDTNKYNELLELWSKGEKVDKDMLNALEDKVLKDLSGKDDIYQRIKWVQLRRSIKTLVDKLTRENIKEIVLNAFELNLNRGLGLLVREIMKAQLRNRNLTPVYASLIAVLNSKINDIGKLTIARVVLQFRKYFLENRRDCIGPLVFICHLTNQRVCNEVLILQIIQLLLERPSNDSVFLTVRALYIVGRLIESQVPAASNMIYDRLGSLMHDSEEISENTCSQIQILFKVRRGGFKKYPPMEEDLDLVEEDDQVTHLVELEERLEAEDYLNIYHFDDKYEENEQQYDNIRNDILGGSDTESEEEEDTGNDEAVDENELQSMQQDLLQIKDMTESNLINFQKTVYLTVMSSMSSQEAVHKLLKLQFDKTLTDKGKNREVLVDMIVKCCSNEKTYSKYYGVIGEKLCSISPEWHQAFVHVFKSYYNDIHQYESNALRNIGKFFGHLYALDRLAMEEGWNEIVLTEEHTNSASRVLLKFIFQELVEEIGITELQERLEDPVIKKAIHGMFPVTDVSFEDNDHIRFAINYFTAIGLGVLTDELRSVLAHLQDSLRGRAHTRRSPSSSSASSRSSSFSRSPLP